MPPSHSRSLWSVPLTGIALVSPAAAVSSGRRSDDSSFAVRTRGTRQDAASVDMQRRMRAAAADSRVDGALIARSRVCPWVVCCCRHRGEVCDRVHRREQPSLFLSRGEQRQECRPIHYHALPLQLSGLRESSRDREHASILQTSSRGADRGGIGECQGLQHEASIAGNRRRSEWPSVAG